MIRRHTEVELQKRVTLDEALLAGVETYRNGCSFRLVRKADNTWWLAPGCYLLVNLITGPRFLLWEWLTKPDYPRDGEVPPRQLDGFVKPETLMTLLARPQCECCGGVRMEPSPPVGTLTLYVNGEKLAEQAITISTEGVNHTLDLPKEPG